MKKKALLASVLLILVGGFFAFDIEQYISLDKLQSMVEHNLGSAIAVFVVLYIFVAALNLPGSGPLTIASGAVFGFIPGVIMVSFASTLGATISMLVARTLLRDWAQKRFAAFLLKVNKGIENDGLSYLFTLRLIPLVPFFVINPVFGLTRMPAWKFYLVSQLGMLPATLLYVNVGASVGALDKVSLASVFSPQIIVSFILLICFPFVAKRLVAYVRNQRRLRIYRKPKRFDTNLVVIGAGSGGLVSAYIAAALKAKVTLVEKNKMGGDCLNTGCVPSKAFIRSAKAAAEIKKAADFGVHATLNQIDFSAIMDRVRKVIQTIEPNDSVERYTELGVDCIHGEALIRSPYEVEVNGQIIYTRNIIIAAGARPRIPQIKGLTQQNYFTSDTIWQLQALPKKLLILGGGAIGCELAQAFHSLGSEVTLIERSENLLAHANPCIGEAVLERFTQLGIDVRLATQISEFESKGQSSYAKLNSNHNRQNTEDQSTSSLSIECDHVLIALGRVANTDSSALRHLPFELNAKGTLKVDENLQTSVPGIYACGDIVGPYQLTHAASHQAWYAAVNALIGRFKRFKVSYKALPWVVFTDPEVAHVGPSHKELRAQQLEFDVTRYPMSELDRAIAEGELHGFVEVTTKKGSDKILAATVIAPRAGEIITEFVAAIKNKQGLNAILSTIHSYPSFGEAARFAAGKWKREHKPQLALRFAQWLFKRMRA